MNEEWKKSLEVLATTTSTDISPVKQSEIFSKLIIQQAGRGRKLAKVISAVAEDISKGAGDTVKVRVFPKVTVAEVAEGATNEAAAYKPFASAVTIKRYSTTVPLTGQSIFTASVDLKAQVIKGISEGWAEKMDEVIVQKLDLGAVSGTNYTPAHKVELASAGNLSDLYAKIKSATDYMRFSLGRHPDMIVITPEAHTQLLTDYEDGTKRYAIEINDDGTVKSVYGLKVIVAPFVSSGSTLSQVHAVILDSSIAVAEAYGMPAKFEEERDASADVYKEVFNAYWGVEVIKADLDGDATDEAIGIAQVTNPAI